MRVVGGEPLQGSVEISGSKNATLPIMAAVLLSNEPIELLNVPDIEDITSMARMMRFVGVDVTQVERSRWRLHAADVTNTVVGVDMTGRIRGSILLLGALLARTGEASVAKPGGDDIGMRRLEQHLEGLRLMGAEVVETSDAYVAKANGLHGARIDLDMPTVTGTENLMMAAAMAEGITVISNAAREPHVVDLARFLVGIGAHINGAGSEHIVIEGSGGVPFHGTEHVVTADYIEAGTYMVAAAATRGDVEIDQVRTNDVRWLTNKLRMAGCDVVEGMQRLRVKGGTLRAVDMTTWPHPGFATDLQSQYVTLMTQAAGVSVVSEAVFENRFRHVAELRKFGAHIDVEGRSAIVEGPTPLHGARASIPDIRSGAALLIAALCAEGESELDNVFHLDRGYEQLDQKMQQIGAQVTRVGAESASATRDFRGVIGD